MGLILDNFPAITQNRDMSCLTASTRSRLLARKTTLETLITAAEAALTSALETGDVESYTFDSGEGSQRTKYRSLEDIQKNLDWLYSRLDFITRRLNGTGIVNLNLRRKRFGIAGTTGRRY